MSKHPISKRPVARLTVVLAALAATLSVGLISPTDETPVASRPIGCC